MLEKSSDVQAYFDANASGYGEFFTEEVAPRTYPTGRVRSQVAIRHIGSTVGFQGSRLVDLGCGTGRLCFECAKLGMQVVGVDFSAGMLAEANKAQVEEPNQGLDQVRFVHASVLETQLPPASFDAATALGLIEYLAADDAAKLFVSAAGLLRRGGVFVVETRNRLFNLTSLNAYTEQELLGGSARQLLQEIAANLERGTSAERLRAFIQRLAEAANQLDRALDEDLAEGRSGKSPQSGSGIENPLRRYQHTPQQLEEWAKAAGLALTSVVGLHPHPLPAKLEQSFPRFYNGLALAFEELSSTPLTLAQCSSIVCRFERG